LDSYPGIRSRHRGTNLSRPAYLKDFRRGVGENPFTYATEYPAGVPMVKRTRPRYRLLPHMTDAYVEVQGPTLNAAFEAAAFAMFDVMTDPTAVGLEFTDRLEVTAHDEVSLLHDWLEQLLLKFDLDGKVYSRFEVEKIAARDGGLHLEAKAYGGLFQPGRHPAKVEIKAVTYHRMEVTATGKGYLVRYILDL